MAVLGNDTTGIAFDYKSANTNAESKPGKDPLASKKLPYPRVWVDIAGFMTSYKSSPQRTFYFKTIVGSPKKQTPVLKSNIENITVNPVWKFHTVLLPPVFYNNNKSIQVSWPEKASGFIKAGIPRVRKFLLIPSTGTT